MVEEGHENKGVGLWVPEEKHTLLAKWLDGTHRARAGWANRVFIDPFCGPGRIRVVGESTTRDGGAVVAWRQAVACKTPFTQMLVGDKNADRVQACAERLRKLNAPVEPFTGPAADTIHDMVARVPRRNTLVLAYIDPYNLEYLSFDIIKALAALPKIDLLVHFSTMDLSRNVVMELDGTRDRFAEAAPGWRDKLGSLPNSQLPAAFFDYWSNLIHSLGFTFSQQKPLIKNEQGGHLYRLVCFSRHELPNRIWDDVAKGPNREFDF
ncbi:MAG: hypothetical protein NVS9B11_12590 [Candidatus Dormibacteraceae bacterium]